MGLFGKIIATPIKIVNAPVKALEDICGVEDDEDRIASMPLEKLAEHVQEIDDDRKEQP